MYSGQSDVIFNGINYSTTDDNNNIEIFITKPLHTFGKDGNIGVAELIIQHQKNNTGNAPLWVCIPINNITEQVGGAGTRALSTSIVESIIDNQKTLKRDSLIDNRNSFDGLLKVNAS